MIVRVDLSFETDDSMPPPRWTLHDALDAMRYVEVEAPTLEVGELYVDEIRRALERESNYERHR